MGFLAIRGMIDGVAGVGQGGLQLTRQIGVVFDEQNTHGSATSRNAAGAVHPDIGHPAARIFPTHHIAITCRPNAQHPALATRRHAAGGVTRIGPGGDHPLAFALGLTAILVPIAITPRLLGEQGSDGQGRGQGLARGRRSDQEGQKKNSGTHHGSVYGPYPLNAG